MSNAFSTMSLNEVAAALAAGYRPTSVTTTRKGRKAVSFEVEALPAVQNYIKARDEAARLLELPSVAGK